MDNTIETIDLPNNENVLACIVEGFIPTGYTDLDPKDWDYVCEIDTDVPTIVGKQPARTVYQRASDGTYWGLDWEHGLSEKEDYVFPSHRFVRVFRHCEIEESWTPDRENDVEKTARLLAEGMGKADALSLADALKKLCE